MGMGVEYYVEGFHLGSPAGLDAKSVIQCFKPQSREFAGGLHRLEYDELNFCDMSLSEEHGQVTSICFFRPCGDARFDRDICRLLAAGPYVLFAPNGNAPVIGRGDMRGHLPPDMIEALGTPVVADQSTNIGSALFG
jgi:hypothetical protein